MKKNYKVTGMTCSACSSRVEKTVASLKGVNAVSVNLLTNTMKVEYEEKEISAKDIEQSVKSIGYGIVSETGKEKQDIGSPKEDLVSEELKKMKKRLLLSFAFLIPLMYVSMGHMWGAPLPAFMSGHVNAVAFGFTQFLLTIPVIYLNQSYFTKGFKSLFHGAPNMDSLIAIGSSASVIYGIVAIYRMSYGVANQDMDLVVSYHMDLYFESAVMILALITLGKYLEMKSKGKTSQALQKLIDLTPKNALVIKDGVEVEVPIEEVKVGDLVVVKPGGRIPVDGEVIKGTSSVDESAITGESIPVMKNIGDQTIAATINKSGYLEVETKKAGQDTVFSKIITLVEEASASKAPIAKIADKIAGIFVPVVMVIAVLTFVVWIFLGASVEFALSLAICVLVISCPCALGLATPVAIMVGMGKGAENGILIKSGEALEVVHNIGHIVLDKTGTITEGVPKVTDVISYLDTDNAFLEIATGLEQKSEHPLAEAVVSYGKEHGIIPMIFDTFENHSGKGIIAKNSGHKYSAGNQKLMDDMEVSYEQVATITNQLAKEGKTPMYFAKEDTLIGILAAADTVKESSKEGIQALRDMGITVTMLTGDNQQTAEGIGKNLHLNQIIAEVLPHEKEAKIAEIQKQGTKVAMVGDGINDAPALARADIGIAIGAGTDVAIESADVILMRNDLRDVATAIKLSKTVIRNIKQNLFWAFFYNCLGIPLAAGVFYSVLGWKLNPMFGAAAMSLSSVFVVSNALRMRYFQTEKVKKQKKRKREKEMYKIKIEGMMCQHCVKHVKEALEKHHVEVEVNLEEKYALVKGDETMNIDTLSVAIEEAGYKVVGVEKI